MGLLNPALPFIYQQADRNQYIGVDGVVMPLRNRSADLSSCSLHSVGGGTHKIYGSKYTVFSARIDGQYMSGSFSTSPTPAKTPIPGQSANPMPSSRSHPNSSALPRSASRASSRPA